METKQTKLDMKTELINYIRDDKRNPRGVVIAIRDGDEILYGYSLKCPEDKWDKELGIAKARARALAKDYQNPRVKERNEIVLNAIKGLQQRALKYFKDISQ